MKEEKEKLNTTEEVEEAIEEETVEPEVEEETETQEEKEETVTEEEPEEEKTEEKPVTEKKEPKKERPEREGRSILSRVLNILLWVVLFAWMALVVIDYFHVQNQEKPQFCWFNEHTTSYNDGSVTECTGLGYKVINYDRTSFKAIEFGPFWIKDRTAEENK